MATIAQHARLDARICNLQASLLDHTGHVYKGLGHDEVRMLVSEIDAARVANGWAPLNMTGRLRPRKYRRLAMLDGWEYR